MKSYPSTMIKKISVILMLALPAAGLSWLLASTILKTIVNYDAATFSIMVLFAIVATTPFLTAWIRKKFDVFEPVYLWVAIYCFLYLLNPFVQITNGEAFSTGSKYLNSALLIAILGLICFYAGYYLDIAQKIATKIPVIKSKISSKKLFYAAWSLIVIGFLGFSYYIHISGEWMNFWRLPHGQGGAASQTTAYLYQLPELMIIGFILIYEILIHKIIIEKKSVRTANIINLVMASLGGVGIYTVLMGSRAYFSWIIIALVVIYFLKKKSRPRLKTIVVLIALLFLLLSVIPLYRGNLYIGSSFSKITDNISFKQIIAFPFNSLNEFNSYLAEVSLVPNWVPYDYFSVYFKTIVHPIPRSIWPEKPTLLNPNWDNFLSKSGMIKGSAESLLGDFYAQMGIWGVIIGTFFSGILWKIFYEYYKGASENRSVILIYAIVIPNIFTYLAQSALIGFLKWLPYMVPITIIALILSRKKQRSIPQRATDGR